MRRRLNYDDVSLLADGVQSDDTQNLLRRLALLAHVTPMLGRLVGNAPIADGMRRV